MGSHDFSHGKGKQGIYAIWNTLNGKVYVGSALDIARRWREHIRNLQADNHRNSYLQRAWDKHEEHEWLFSCLEEVASKPELLVREQHWIDTLRAAERAYGYNLAPTAGSQLGFRHSEESKEKMRSWNHRILPNTTYLTYNGLTKPQGDWAEEYGIPLSTLRSRLNGLEWSVEEALETPHTPLTKYTVDDKTEGIETWASETGLHPSTIRRRLEKGMTIGEALAVPVEWSRCLTFEGKTLNVTEWATKIGISQSTLSLRLARGWSVERALGTNKTGPTKIALNGESKTLSEWCSHYGILKTTALMRHRSGWDWEEALTTPVRQGNYKRKAGGEACPCSR